MLKRFTAFTLGLSVCACGILGASAFTQSGTPTATVKKTSVNMRQGASTASPVVTRLEQGAVLNVISANGDWYLLQSGNNFGYVRNDMLQIDASPNQAQDSFIPMDELDAMKLSEISQAQAIAAANAILAPSISTDALPNSTDGTYAQTKEQRVQLQSNLQTLGFYSGKLDGAFGAASTAALKAFQRAYGLPVNGKNAAQTQQVMQSALANGGNGSSAARVTEQNNVVLAEWYNYMKQAIPKKESLQCIDVRTGTRFYLRPFACGSHADVEPPTREDTQTIYAVNNNKWSWTPRPILVFINGIAYAAAINVQPHGPDTLPDNGMDGQLCMHFLSSRQHNTDSESSSLQQAIQYALDNGGKLL